MAHVAGHTFDSFGRCACGRTWLNCLDQRARWAVGEKDIAHVGALNAAEVDQLITHAVKEEERIWAAVTGRYWELEEEVAAGGEP